MVKVKPDFKRPIEGWNKKTLPLIPASDLLQPVPLGPAHRRSAFGNYVSIQKQTDESGRRSNSGSDLATDAVLTLQRYNRYVSVLQESEDYGQRELSGRFIELGKDITAAISRADEEVRGKLVEMGQISQEMFGRLELEEECFADGSWAGETLFEHEVKAT